MVPEQTRGDGSPWMPRAKGASVHEEMELLVESGLSPAEALVAASRAPAEFLKRSDLGMIAVGSQADLVLLRQNPLENIRATREISGVMLDGRWIDFENR